MIILSKKFAHEKQDFEIFVKYDKELQLPIEVKNITLHTHGNWYPVGNIFDKFLHDAIWKLINETDWISICKEICEPAPKRLHPEALQILTIASGG